MLLFRAVDRFGKWAGQFALQRRNISVQLNDVYVIIQTSKIHIFDDIQLSKQIALPNFYPFQ